MPKVLAIAVLVGVISGLLVGGFHNIFTVPVIERAIVLEEERATAEAKAKGVPIEQEAPLVSLGIQRVGMAVGTGIYGLILGLVFAAGYALLRQVAPRWQPIFSALAVGALGFWALSLFPFIKYPLNPPGVGEVSTLSFRQGFQTLFFVLSIVGAAGLLMGLRQVSRRPLRIRTWPALPLGHVLVALLYGGFAVVIFLALPANPDPVTVPVDLLSLYRALTMVGQFLLWLLLALGVALVIMYSEQLARKRAATPRQSRISPHATPRQGS